MPESVSIERRQMIEKSGGKVILSKGDMIGANKEYQQLIKKNPFAYLPK